MKKFSVKVKVPIRVTWRQELVEDDSNFYIKLTPRVMTGGGDGTPRLTKVTVGNVTRIITTKRYTFEQRAVLEEAMKKAIDIAKKDPDIKKALIDGAKGKQTTVKSQTPITSFTQEDIEAGREIKRAQQEQENQRREEDKKLAETDEFAKQLLYGRKDKVDV